MTQHTQETLKRDLIFKRILTTGFGKHLCKEALDACDGDEIAAISLLTQRAFDSISENPPMLDADPSFDFDFERNQELESLIAIYPDSVKETTTDTGQIITVALETGRDTKVEFYISSASRYPFELPGCVIRDDSLPAYIRLGIFRALLKELSCFLGMPMLFSIISWLQENMDEIIQNPPKLVSLHQVSASVDTNLRQQLKKTSRASNRSLKKVSSDSNAINAELLKSLQIRESEPGYQKMLKIRENLPSYKFKKDIAEVPLKHSYSRFEPGNQGEPNRGHQRGNWLWKIYSTRPIYFRRHDPRRDGWCVSNCLHTTSPD